MIDEALIKYEKEKSIDDLTSGLYEYEIKIEKKGEKELIKEDYELEENRYNETSKLLEERENYRKKREKEKENNLLKVKIR